MSLRAKIISIGIGLPAILLIVLLSLYIKGAREQAFETHVSNARSVCLTVEAVRTEMEENWQEGVFTIDQLREWAANDQLHKVIKSVPVATAWNTGIKNAKEAGYTFRVPKFEPRNPKNQPDEFESRVLNKMKAESLDEYHEIDESMNSMRYFRSIRLSSTCMYCHGEPAKSAEYWGNDKGLDPTGAKMEGWKVGEIHGAFEIIQPMDKSDAAMASTLFNGILIVFLGILAMSAIYVVVINRSVNKPISKLIATLQQGTESLSATSQEISASSQALAEGASEQAASIEEISANLEEITSMTRQNADNSKTAADLMNATNKVVEKATGNAMDMDTAMQSIKSASDQTSHIIKSIDEIAFQTNLLALNAAVEAARAGEAGKGFAVVAEEVRNLAMRSAEAAKNTGSLIQDTLSRVDGGVQVVSGLKSALLEVNEHSGKVSNLVDEISAASREQAQGVDQVNTAISQMDGVTQQNAAAAEEGASASEEMSGQAKLLAKGTHDLIRLVRGASQG